MNWLYVHFGIAGTGSYYGFWSGAGSDIGELSILVALVTIVYHTYRRHNCEVHHCPRIARHMTAAGHLVCRKHHPEGHLSSQDVIDQHYEALSGGGSDRSGGAASG